ncbi:MAG: CRISPR system precrRNA processing endoribonuclease RAMP protein Cas6 [Lachnospiraceae bacterium]|nr:CRISPR system precrRNA processing endoribonuclease RAMP protein Cas6 [Lachnospiraceae bacterium]
MYDMGFRNIRYVRLQFKLVITEGTAMPKNKNSALRGGMGEMLLRAHCIRDRECQACDFESECIVRRTMYSKMELQPVFMTAGDSVGYVIDCADHRERFYAGDELEFYLTLFGKTIVYFSQFLNAFYALGREGIGKNHSRFEIIAVNNSTGQPILDGMNVIMNNYRVEVLGNYIDYRMRRLGVEAPDQQDKAVYEGEGEWKDVEAFEYEAIEDEALLYQMSLHFRTPLTVKYHGEYIQDFDILAIIEALKRRLYMLLCFEGVECDLMEWNPEHVPRAVSEEHYSVTVKRHSNRKKSNILLRGIEGNLTAVNIDRELLELMLAGEITHIGKNTSFGFGGYKINIT